jgi:hypothetical protein
MGGVQPGEFLSFRAVGRGQTYLNLLYLLVVALPLGVLYFVFLVAGISLGIGLAVIFVGLFILLGVMAGARGLAAAERGLISGMLGAPVEAPPAPAREGGLWRRAGALMGDPGTWKSMLYLLLRFPLGIFSFSVAVSLVAVSLALIAAPLYYLAPTLPWYSPEQFVVGNGVPVSAILDTPLKAALLTVLGLMVGFLSLHAMNGLARLHVLLAKGLLGRRQRL